MPRFESFDGVTLSYEIEGEGTPVLLLHGFASDSFLNWVRPGVIDALTSAGYRTIQLDQRGHGSSDKPHETSAYGGGAMVRDAQTLLDRLELPACLGVGYSMGARTLLDSVVADDRIHAAVLGGIGANMLRSREWGGSVAEAMLAEDKSTVTDSFARSFRDFADLTGADRVALAAVQANARPPLEGLADIAIPVLVLCGDNDPLVGDPHELASVIPKAKAVIVGGTHLNVVNNPDFKRALVAFLDENRERADR